MNCSRYYNDDFDNKNKAVKRQQIKKEKRDIKHRLDKFVHEYDDEVLEGELTRHFQKLKSKGS